MDRLQRLHEIQEQVWHEAALDLRLNTPSEVPLPTPLPSGLLEIPMLKSEVSVSPVASLQTSVPNGSATTTTGAS